MATLKEIENIENTLKRGFYLSKEHDVKLQEIDFITIKTIINNLLENRYNELEIIKENESYNSDLDLEFTIIKKSLNK